MTETPRGGQSADRIDLPQMPLPPGLPADDFPCCSQPATSCSKFGSNNELAYTAAEVKVLTEAALRLGRKEAGEEIAVALEAEADRDYEAADDLRWAAARARNIASQPSPDATSGRTDPGMDSDLPPEPEAVREPRSECPGCGTDGTGLESHSRDCPRNPYAREAP